MRASDIIDLVHRRDELVGERDRLVGNLDREIAEIDTKLESLGAVRRGNGHGRVVDARADVNNEDESSDDRGKAARLLSMISESNVLDYGVASRSLYGEDSPKMRKRLRSLLAALATHGRIQNIGRNQWGIIEE